MFEKEAEEWVKENMDCCKTDNSVNQSIPYFDEEERCCAKSAFKDGAEFGYNKGLEAGRPKWYKVADGDLPEYGVEVLDENGDKVIYDAGGSQGWIAYSEYCGRYVEVDEPVAWCEIPKYIEK